MEKVKVTLELEYCMGILGMHKMGILDSKLIDMNCVHLE